MNFEAVFKILIENFQKYQINFAIIGGFALYVSGLTRSTEDIDFLIAKTDLPKIKKLMLSLGYDIIHESQDVINFVGKMAELGRVDFLLAHRKYALSMLERAEQKEILNGKFKVKVIKTEDLIGLKVQSSSNDPSRYHRDIADIESLIKINYKTLNMDLINEYFKLFNREKELVQILEKVKNAE